MCKLFIKPLLESPILPNLENPYRSYPRIVTVLLMYVTFYIWKELPTQ